VLVNDTESAIILQSFVQHIIMAKVKQSGKKCRAEIQRGYLERLLI